MENERHNGLLRHFFPKGKRIDSFTDEDISDAENRMVSQGVGLLIGSDHRQMHTADTLLKPLKQDAVHRYIYMAYLKNGAYTSAVEQIIAFAEARKLERRGSGYAGQRKRKAV